MTRRLAQNAPQTSAGNRPRTTRVARFRVCATLLVVLASVNAYAQTSKADASRAGLAKIDAEKRKPHRPTRSEETGRTSIDTGRGSESANRHRGEAGSSCSEPITAN